MERLTIINEDRSVSPAAGVKGTDILKRLAWYENLPDALRRTAECERCNGVPMTYGKALEIVAQSIEDSAGVWHDE